MGKIAGRGKVVYIWISPDPAKAGPHWELLLFCCCLLPQLIVITS